MLMLLAAAVWSAFSVPVHFEANRGQAGAEFPYVGRAADNSVVLVRPDRLVLRGLDLQFIGANATAGGTVERPMQSYSNYFHGNRRVTHARHYGALRFTEIYRGIDLVYYSQGGKLEYDLNVAPGVDPARIRMKIGRNHSVRLLANGDLRIGDQATLHRPRAFQEKEEVDARFVLKGPDEFQIVLGAFDRSRALRIDPVLSYAIPMGGAAVATDAAGNSYFVGQASLDMVGSPGSIQPLTEGNGDAYIAKVSPSGELIFSTFLGGYWSDRATAVAVDSAENIYVGGETGSGDFPGMTDAQPRALMTTYVFAAKLSANGTDLLWVRPIESGGSDRCGAISINETSGAVYLAGTTYTSAFPLATAAGTIFVARINASGVHQASYAIPSTHRSNWLWGSAVDVDGDVYVVGSTPDPSFPQTPGVVSVAPGSTSSTRAFVTRINADLSGIVASVLIGGSGTTWAAAVAVDAAKDIYVTGLTSTSDFPTTVGALRTLNSGGNDAFLMKLCPDLKCIRYSTYFGGSAADSAKSIALAPDGKVVVGGSTMSRDFPLASALQTRLADPPALKRVSGFGASSTIQAEGLDLGNNITIHPLKPNEMLNQGSQIRRSTDGGTTWSVVVSADQYPLALARAPSNPDIVYYSGFGLWKSADGGLNWTSVVANTRLQRIAVDAVNPNLVYGTDLGDVFYAIQGGSDVLRPNVLPAGTRMIVTHPTRAGTVILASAQQIVRTDDGGKTFRAVDKPPQEEVRWLAIANQDPNWLYVAGWKGLYRTNDDGSSYERLPVDRPAVVAIAPSNPEAIYVLQEGKVLVSRNRGASWESAGTTTAAVDAIAIHPDREDEFLGQSFGSPDGFVAVFNGAASGLEFSTYLGSTGLDSVNGVAADSAGSLLATGQTTETFPFTQTVPYPTKFGAKITVASSPCQAMVSPKTAFLQGAGVVRATVIAGSGCNWETQSNEAWLTVGESTGSGAGWVEVRAEPNPGPTRSGTVTLAGELVTVTQAPSACTFTVTYIPPDSNWEPAQGRLIPLGIDAAPGCSWQLTSALPRWLTPVGAVEGTGPGTLSLQAAPAETLSMRIATVWVAGRLVQITQGGTCFDAKLTLAQTVFPQSGSESLLSIDVGESCSWTVSSSNWVSPVQTSGKGKTDLAFTVTPNQTVGPDPRVGWIQLKFKDGSSLRKEISQASPEASTRAPRSLIRNADGDFELYTYGSLTPVVLGGATRKIWKIGRPLESWMVWVICWRGAKRWLVPLTASHSGVCWTNRALG
ncbi:MAG: SBBP repeat-containing protein [Bryobacterales bacterium]|nr:SBBP repeat-containing protein [Bryobacterales bacterium]